jgi:hypothetical protein
VTADAVIAALGYEPNEDLIEQVTPMVMAIQLYIDRNKKREGVWARSGARGCAFHVFAKAERLWAQVMRSQTDRDPIDRQEILDLINYSAMLLRQLEASNFDGFWDWDQVNR